MNKIKFPKPIIGLVLVSLIFLFFYNDFRTRDQETSVFFKNGQATDPMVRLLGLTGIRIKNDDLMPEKNWPNPKLTLSSRKLGEITDAIQGKKNSELNWIIQGERWQTTGLRYITFTEEQAQNILDLIAKDLKLGIAMHPQKRQYAGVLFLGSTLQNVRERLSFLNAILAENKFVAPKIFLLTGTRPLDITVGETPENLLDPDGLIAVRPDWRKPEGSLPTDEGPMIQWVFQQSRSDAISPDQVVMIYAGIGEGRNRATTKTTVEEWLKTHPPDGLYLAVSNQPFNLYQKLVIERVLLENNRPGIRFEVIGPAENKPYHGFDVNKRVAYALDNIARICFELMQQYR